MYQKQNSRKQNGRDRRHGPGVARAVLVALAVLALSVGVASAQTTSYTYDSLGRLNGVGYDCAKATVYAFDAAGNRTSVATAASSNAAPNAVDDIIAGTYNTAVTFDPRANDSDVDCDTLTISNVGTPSHGSASINSGVSITYTPTTGFSGADTFTYTISDGHSHTATAIVTVNVPKGNSTPTAANDSVTTARNMAVTFDPRVNDTDPEGDALSIYSVGTPSHGTASINTGGGSITYTPTTGYSGTDSFNYTVSDGHSTSSPATITVTITADNQPPVVVNDNAAASKNTAVTFDPRSNDSDPDGDALTISAVYSPAHGTAVVNSGVSITYTPTTGYTGIDSFTYVVTDGHGGSGSAIVTVTVTEPGNHSPVCGDSYETYTAPPGAHTYGPQSMCTDPDSDPLTISAVTTPDHGSVSINSGSVSVTYSSGPYRGNAIYTFTVSDGHGGTATANAYVTIVDGGG